MTSQKYTILYGRLSQDDGKTAESNSITNQRLMLEKYARDNGFDNVLFLADDGYTGTNFERPSWKQIEDMIKRGEVETLIVKDLSRLGREYLQVGYYLELYFPNMGVRFIAINDGVDSLVEGSNDFSTIRNWANEGNGSAVGLPTATKRWTRTAKRSSPTMKPQRWCKGSSPCVPPVKAPIRSPVSFARIRC